MYNSHTILESKGQILYSVVLQHKWMSNFTLSVVTHSRIICWHGPQVVLELRAPFIGRFQAMDFEEFFQQRQQHRVVVWHYKQIHTCQVCTGLQITKWVPHFRVLVAVRNKHLHKGTQHFTKYITCIQRMQILY